MLALSEEERKDRARAMAAGRAAKRADRPRRLAEIEARMDALSRELQDLPAFPEGRERRQEIRQEIADLGRERLGLKWGGA